MYRPKKNNAKLVKVCFAGVAALALTACVSTTKAPVVTCVNEADIYLATDNRDAKAPIFQQALACQESSAVRAALLGLGRIGGPPGLIAIRPMQADPRDEVREMAAFATGIAASRSSGSDLIKMLENEASPKVREQIYLGLGTVGGKKSLVALSGALATEADLRARGAIYQGLGIAFAFQRDAGFRKSDLDFTEILSTGASASTSRELAFMLARIRDLPSYLEFEELQQFVGAVGNEEALAYLIRALARYQSAEPEAEETSAAALQLIQRYTRDRHLGTQIEAVRALGQFVGNPDATAAAVAALGDRNEIIQGTALQSLGRLGTSDPQQASAIAAYLDSESAWLVSLALNTVATLDPRAAMDRARLWLVEGEATEKQRAALTVLNRLAPGEINQLLEPFIDSSDKLLNNAAEAVAEEQAPSPTNPAKRWSDPLPGGSRVTLDTTRGSIVIELFQDTPYTVANFVELVENGFYNDSYFSRVIPNFVAQGGDELGQGGGSVGYAIREELTMRSHVPGTIGQATSGKDTGGAQFFINLAPNLHLDNNYTIFGQVISGMDVAYRLQQGDKILSARVER